MSAPVSSHPLPRLPQGSSAFDQALDSWIGKGSPGENRVEAARRIQEVRESQGETLDLQGLGLQDLPIEICSLDHLKHLNLRGNALLSFEYNEGAWPELLTIDLRDNLALRVFPAALAHRPLFTSFQSQAFFRVTCTDHTPIYLRSLCHFFELRENILELFQGHLPENVDFARLQQVLLTLEPPQLYRLKVIFSGLPSMRDFIETRENTQMRIAELLQGFVDYKPLATAWKNDLPDPLHALNGNDFSNLFCFFEQQHRLYALSGKSLPDVAKGILDIYLQLPLVLWMRKNNCFSWTGVHALQMRLKEKFGFQIRAQFLHPDPLVDAHLEKWVEECGTHVLSTKITDVLFILMEYDSQNYNVNWIERVKREYAADLRNITSPWERRLFIEAKTRELLVELGFNEADSNPHVTPFDRSLDAWVQGRTVQGRANRATAAERIKDARLNQSQVLDLSHLQLATLPAALGTLHALKALDLSNNRLAQLPVELIELEALIEIHIGGNLFIEGSPLTLRESSVLWNLPLVWSFTEELRVFEYNQHVPPPPHVLQFQELRSTLNQLLGQPLLQNIDLIGLAASLKMRTGDELATLNRFFTAAGTMRDFSEPATHVHTQERMGQILQGIATTSSFLNDALTDLESRDARCIDEAAFTFSQIEILRLLHCVAPGAGIQGLAKILIGLKRLELLEAWVVVRSLIGSNVPPEGGRLLDLRRTLEGRVGERTEVLEGSMVLRLRLRESLWLPVETQGIQFEICAEGEIGPLEPAAAACQNEVLSLTSHIHTLLPILMENETWRNRITLEAEAEWLAMQNRAPLSLLNDFLMNYHDQSMSDDEKVACLVGTSIHSHLEEGQLRSLFEIQQEVQEEMARVQYRLFLDTSIQVLARLDIVDDGSHAKDILRVRQELEQADSVERARRRSHRPAARTPEPVDEKVDEG